MSHAETPNQSQPLITANEARDTASDMRVDDDIRDDKTG